MKNDLTEARFTIDEVAQMLGVSKRAAEMKAAREEWRYETVTVRGGSKRLYAIDVIPDEKRPQVERVKRAYRDGAAAGAALTLSEHITTLADRQDREASLGALVAIDVMPQKKRSRIEDKLAILALFQSYRQASGLGVTLARAAFVQAWRQGKIDADRALRTRYPTLSTASLQRWADEPPARLAGRYGNRSGATIIDSQPEMAGWMKGFITDRPHASSTQILAALRAYFRARLTKGADGVLQPAEIPSERRVQAWVTRYKRENHALVAAQSNPDDYRSRYQAAFGSRSEGIERLNQLWEIDGSPVDAMTTDGRCTINVIVDVFSRRMKVTVSKTATAVAVGLAIRRAITDWGVPEVIKSDNGSDFTSRYIDLACKSLAIERVLCDPYSPDQKPHVERGIGTFQHDLLPLAAGYVGSSVAERKAIESRKSFAQRLQGEKQIEVRMSAAQLQEVCDQWCEAVYHHHAHDGLRGKSPFEVAIAWTTPVRRIESERVLDVLLAPTPEGHTRKVGKKGIRVGGFSYSAGELGAYMNDTVLVRYDPDGDAGRLIVYSTEGEFITVAECPEILGTSRAAIAAAMSATQKAVMKKAKTEAREEAKRFKNLDLVQLILDDAVSRAENVTALPTAALPHQTPAIEQAARVADRLINPRIPIARPMTDEEREYQRGIEEEIARGGPARVIPINQDDDMDANYRRWLMLDRRIGNGDSVSDHERAWHESYRGSDEYRTMEGLAKDFPQLKAI